MLVYGTAVETCKLWQERAAELTELQVHAYVIMLKNLHHTPRHPPKEKYGGHTGLYTRPYI